MRVSVQEDDFDVGHEHKLLSQDSEQFGAVVTFTGLVRDQNQGHTVRGLTLEHYPGMTEKALMDIVLNAKKRWDIGKVTVIHRIGTLMLNDNIVFVGVSSKHRGMAFEAVEFIMDYLKNEAPFWKKEVTLDGERWVDFNDQDSQALKRWR